jgi:hypothetical protein
MKEITIGKRCEKIKLEEESKVKNGEDGTGEKLKRDIKPRRGRKKRQGK